MTVKTAEEFDTIHKACMADRTQREMARYSPPLIRLYDAQWRLHGTVRDCFAFETQQLVNQVAPATLTLRPTDPLAQWIMDRMDSPIERTVHLVSEKNGIRWSGKIKSYEIITGDRHNRVVFHALDDMEQLKFIHCWANPFLGASLQVPKYWTLFGPAIYMLKLTLFCNLFRISGNLWNIPDNPLNPASWVEGLTPWEWPNLVMPASLAGDGSPWVVISTRFENFFDLATQICNEHGLVITYRRWLTGDPQPFPGFYKVRNGQCFWDIVDKSSALGETALGGNIGTGLMRTIQSYADNAVDTIIGSVANPVNPPEYSKKGSLLFTLKKQPYVIYRHQHGLQKMKYTRQAAGAIQMVTGGHSAPGVNEIQGLPIKLVGNILGAIVPGLDTLGDIADSVLKNIYEDTFLAFAALKSPIRAAQAGWNPLEEQFIAAPGKAYTLSMALTLARGFYNTRDKASHQFDIGTGAPYLVGANGQGHFGLGDRIGAEVPYRDGRVVVEQVQGLTMRWEPGAPPVWQVTLGDPTIDEMPIERLFRDTGRLYNAIHNLGVV